MIRKIQKLNLKPFLKKANKKIAILGAGSFGIALSIILSQKNYIKMWDHDHVRARNLNENKRSDNFLIDFDIPDNVFISSNIEKIIPDADMIIFATPTNHIHRTCERIKKIVKRKAIIIGGSRGFDIENNKRPSEILKDYFSKNRGIATISGPYHAEELASFLPSSMVVSSKSSTINEIVQKAFTNYSLRVYTNRDQLGVEIAGALKNIYAIASGILDGYDYGDSAKSTLITRGIYEMVSFGTRFGAKKDTFFGLSGIGDLTSSCNSKLSRDRLIGLQLARGRNLNEILKSMRYTAEGVKTTESVYEIAKKKRIEVPIANQIYKILFEGLRPKQGIEELMDLICSKKDYWV